MTFCTYYKRIEKNLIAKIEELKTKRAAEFNNPDEEQFNYLHRQIKRHLSYYSELIGLDSDVAEHGFVPKTDYEYGYYRYETLDDKYRDRIEQIYSVAHGHKYVYRLKNGKFGRCLRDLVIYLIKSDMSEAPTC